ADGPATGTRALDLRVLGGIDLRLLPDRGLDLGGAWYGGLPLHWLSAVGEIRPLSEPRDEDWASAFGGGLVTTCGLRNVGAPSEGHGLHGAYSHQRARVVSTERVQDDGPALRVRGVVREGAALGPTLEVQRTWTTWLGRGRVRLADVTTNLGATPEPAPLLYHVNVGPALWAPGSSLVVARHGRTLARDPEAAAGEPWDEAPHPTVAPERVWEHELTPDADGLGTVVVRSHARGLTLTLRWDATTLPRVHQWVHPAPGVYALGLEPANCSVLGRAHDRAEGRLPVLEPGERRHTSLEITVEPDR
ncbi:MAG: hypothetical protein AVDCRST_MAG79-2371, partial [uncultured Thermoleophilia bacterium]